MLGAGVRFLRMVINQSISNVIFTLTREEEERFEPDSYVGMTQDDARKLDHTTLEALPDSRGAKRARLMQARSSRANTPASQAMPLITMARTNAVTADGMH